MPTMARHRSAWAALVVLLLAGAGLWAPAAGASGGEARDHLDRVNALRASRGLAPLTLDGELSALAQRWAEGLAAEQRLRHAADLSVGVTASWTKLGENLGRGPSTDAVFAAFVASPAHYANLVDPAFTHLGVGVVWVGATQYTVHRFRAAGSDPPPAPVSADRPATGALPPAVPGPVRPVAGDGPLREAPAPGHPPATPPVDGREGGTGAPGPAAPAAASGADPMRVAAVLDALRAVAR
jgi:hypothetical protein